MFSTLPHALKDLWDSNLEVETRPTIACLMAGVHTKMPSCRYNDVKENSCRANPRNASSLYVKSLDHPNVTSEMLHPRFSVDTLTAVHMDVGHFVHLIRA